MIKINLVPAEILAKARQRLILMQASAAGGAFGLMLVLASFTHWFGLHRLQNEYNYDEAELKRLSAIVAQVEEIEKAAAAVRARLGVIEDLLKGRAYYPIFMSDFARTVPGGVRVTQLNTSSQPNSALRLTISAVANGNEDIAAWLRTLEKSQRFSGVELGPISTGGVRQYSFTLTTMYTLKL